MDLLSLLNPSIIGAVCAAAALLTLALLARRVSQTREHQVELHKLQHAVQSAQSELDRLLKAAGPVASALRHVSDIKLQLDQVQQDQKTLTEKMSNAGAVLDRLATMPNALADMRREQTQRVKAITAMSEVVEDWNARLSAASYEVTRLLQSESVMDLLGDVEMNECDTRVRAEPLSRSKQSLVPFPAPQV